MTFSTSSGVGALTERMRIDSSGNVAIGTTLPSSVGTISFHIHSNIGNNWVHFTDDDTGQTANDGFIIGIDGLEAAVIRNRENTDLEFWTNDTRRMTIAADGDVGIGTITPSALLHLEEPLVTGGSGAIEILRLAWNDSLGENQATGDGVKISFHTSSVNNALGTTEGASIAALKGNGGEADTATDLIFSVNNGTVVSEAMRILDTGNVGIGHNNPSIALDVDGEIGGVGGSLVCQTIGALGYILLDEQSTTTLSNANFTGFTVDFDNQSTDAFAVYKMLLFGNFDGNGSTPFIRAQFIDTVGNISGSNNYQTTVIGWSGATINNTRLDSFYVINRGSNSSNIFHFSGDYTIHLGNSTFENRMIGQHEMNVADGTASIVRNVSASITNVATVNTRITGMGFQAFNVNTGNDRELRVRIYRLL